MPVTDKNIADEIRRVAPGSTWEDVKAAWAVVRGRLCSHDDDRTETAMCEVMNRYDAAPRSTEGDVATAESVAETINHDFRVYGKARFLGQNEVNVIAAALSAARADDKLKLDRRAAEIVRLNDLRQEVEEDRDYYKSMCKDADAEVQQLRVRVRELEAARADADENGQHFKRMYEDADDRVKELEGAALKGYRAVVNAIEYIGGGVKDSLYTQFTESRNELRNVLGALLGEGEDGND